MNNIQNIVFDLGGVLITLDRNEAVRRFKEIGLQTAEELLDPYHQKGVFLQLEEGTVSREEFYTAINQMAGKDIPGKDIDYALYGFLVDVPVYKLEMLEQLRKKYKLYLLSNTNPIIMEWAHTPELWGSNKVLKDYFDKMYLSYEIGATKPAKAIFDHLLADSGIIPSETLFIDDGPANVEIGSALGMQTYMPQNGEDFRHIFE